MSQSTNTPHTTTPPPPHTPSATSIPDDSETEYAPTPLHSPGGPQYEDLPPSYDFALNDARSGVASLDASQIEAHRVSASERPDEPEVWEYRVRGEGGEVEEGDEREEAPAYDGHVPVQHVASSASIPVGRVGGFDAPSASVSRGGASFEDPPHSIPEVGSSSGHVGAGGRGGQHGQPWTPFGAPGFGPFGAPGSGPFGAPGNGPFGRPGRGPFGSPGRGRGGRSSRSTGPRSGPSQDWAAFGQNLGKMGEEFGRRMGNWGEQFGRQAGVMGEQFGRQAGAMGQQLGRGSGAWAAAYSGRAAGVQSTTTAGPSNAERNQPPHYDEPPSYQGPAGVAGQETGVLPNTHQTNAYPPEKAPEKALAKPTDEAAAKHKTEDYDYDSDSDSSCISSISSSSSSSSTSSSPQTSRTQARRLQKREFRARKRALVREYREKKEKLRESGGKGKGKGKGKGREWREVKREYKAKKRALRRERVDAKRAWKSESKYPGV